MKSSSPIRTTCGLCYAGCGMLVHHQDGRPVKLTGDPQSPVNRGALCEKAGSALELLNHPDRLRHPLRRVGPRGGGDWKAIGWKEALEVVSENLLRVRDRLASESVVFVHGAAKGLQDSYLARFANVFGSPNVVSQGYVCFLPRKFASQMTYGFLPVPDYDHPPRCILVWGSRKSKIGEYRKVLAARQRGAKLIVIDPLPSELARQADLWVQLRPGSDLAFALSLIHTLTQERLFDEAFVREWTLGFDRLHAHVADYSPEKVAEIAWVDPALIRETARMYTRNKPACLQVSNGVEHNINSFQTARALSILRAITGNLGVPGGELFQAPLPIPDRYAPELTLEPLLPEEKRRLRLGAEHRFLPLYRFAQPPSVITAMIEGKPYPVRAAYVQGANPLLSYANAKRTFQAFTSLDFLAVADLFMTPTAALADVVLPAASYLEFDSIVHPPYYPIAQVQQKVTEVDECRPDFKILNELAGAMGMPGDAFEDVETGFLDLILKPLGLRFSDFRQASPLAGKIQHRHYTAAGFTTPSGKVELFSQRLAHWGFDPLPVYREMEETPLGDPEGAREFPLLFTSWKSRYFVHSAGRQIPALRRHHPEPVVQIHPDTASGLGIDNGDLVRLSTRRGAIVQRAVLSPGMQPGVVGVDYGWWFPEDGPGGQYGWARSNVNVLTSDQPPYSRELGTVNLRGIFCRVEKAASARE